MKNVKLLFVIQMCSSFIPAYVIERLFWEMRGMTVSMVVYTEILYAVTIIVMEIPTGVLADKWGRKPMLVVAAGLGCLEFTILLYATEFWHFASAVFFAAIATAASSGAVHALLYESLSKEQQEKNFDRSVGYLQAVEGVTFIVVALLGSWSAERFGYEWNYAVSLLAMCVAFVFTCLLTEPEQKTGGDEEPLYIWEGIQALWKQPEQYVVLLSGIILGASIVFIDEFWQLYVRDGGLSVGWFGIVMSVLFLLRIPGQVTAHLLVQRYAAESILLWVLAIFSLGFLYVSVAPGLMGLAAIFIICLCDGLVYPIVVSRLHRSIDTKARATAESLWSWCENLVMVLIGFCFSYAATMNGLTGGFAFIGAVCGLSFVICMMMVYKKRSSRVSDS
ncbi:MFS transporter [Halobacillus fulvus]|nr:MFS transporter [Halobacillus fulvus]